MAGYMKNAECGFDQGIPLPPIMPSGIARLAAAGAIDVSGAAYIVFDKDCDGLTMNEGTAADATNYLTLVPGAGFTIHKDVTSIYVSGACGYILVDDVVL